VGEPADHARQRARRHQRIEVPIRDSPRLQIGDAPRIAPNEGLRAAVAKLSDPAVVRIWSSCLKSASNSTDRPSTAESMLTPDSSVF